MPDFNDPNRYLDLSKWFEKQTSYIDFEGMAGTEGILERAEKYASMMATGDEAIKVLKTLLCHYLFTARDTAEDPDDNSLAEVAAAFSIFLGVRYVLKEDAK